MHRHTTLHGELAEYTMLQVNPINPSGTICVRFIFITFHKPSLARIRKSEFSVIVSSTTYGSELRCFFKLRSPNALATASCPSTRGTSPAMQANKFQIELYRSRLYACHCNMKEVVISWVSTGDIHKQLMDEFRKSSENI